MVARALLQSDVHARPSVAQIVAGPEQEVRTTLGLARDHPAVGELARTNLALVRLRTGPDGLTNRIERTENQLATTKRALAELEESFGRISKRVTALERTGLRIDDAVGHHLRQELQKLPPLTTHRALSRRLGELLKRGAFPLPGPERYYPWPLI